MEFENFALSRDLWYLFSFCAGAAAGCAIALFLRRSTVRAKNARITAAFCFLSGAVAALALAVIFSTGRIFFAFPVFVPSLILFVLGILSLCFFKFAAALVLAAGLAVVIVTLNFLAYPRAEAGAEFPLNISVQASGDGVMIQRNKVAGSQSVTAEVWNLAQQGANSGQGANNGQGEDIEVQAIALSADPRWPVFGGERRGEFSLVLKGDEAVFAKKTFFLPGITADSFRAIIPAEALYPGMTYTTRFDGQSLSFDPPPR
jgi:hypothetical protein